MDVFLVYGGVEELVVTGYTNASFQTDKDDSKSKSGYVFTINGDMQNTHRPEHFRSVDKTPSTAQA